MNLLVFTDLDGILLDRGDYSYEAAKGGFDRIFRQQIPMIFTTSKTRLEIERLQADLQIHEPFIPENGAAIYFPDGYRNFKINNGFRQPPYTAIQLGAAYCEIRRFVYAVRERFNVKGFGDLSVDEVVLLTGLPHEQAVMAKLREYTEPFLLEEETKIDELAAIAASRGFKITSGGRFFNIIGIRQDKGHAVRLCAEIFDKNMKGGVVTVGLGNSANDVAMLKSVDIPILLPHDDGTYEDIDISNIVKADHPGSRGWNNAILQVVNSVDESKVNFG